MIKRQLLIFLFVGVTTVLVDYLVYMGLALILGGAFSAAKAASFIAGAIFAYFANRTWTFARRDLPHSRALRFAALYLASLAANVGTNFLLLHLLPGLPYRLQVAFLVATTISAVLNFLGMKYFVFVLDK